MGAFWWMAVATRGQEAARKGPTKIYALRLRRVRLSFSIGHTWRGSRRRRKGRRISLVVDCGGEQKKLIQVLLERRSNCVCSRCKRRRRKLKSTH